MLDNDRYHYRTRFYPRRKLVPTDHNAQWCDIHRGNCHDINLLRRRTGDWVRICRRCAAVLQLRGMLKAGPIIAGHPSLQLVGPCVEKNPKDAHGRPLERKGFIVELTEEQVIILRARGYEVLEDADEYDYDSETCTTIP